MIPSTAAWVARYIQYGLALVQIPAGHKAPLHEGWNKPGGYVTDPAEARQRWVDRPNDGIGVVLGPSGLCSIDVDSPEHAEAALGVLGIDLDSLRKATPTIEGNSPRYRSMFRAPPGVVLGRKALSWPAKEPGGKPVVVFELRAGDIQDILPPTIHPGTWKPYIWQTPPNTEFPLLPDALLELWQQWDSYRKELSALCPWSSGFNPESAPRAPGARPDVIAAFNRARSVEDLLTEHKYTPKGKRWLSPTSSSGLAGVTVLDGRVYSHHASDPLADDHAHDAFDIFRILDHGGDARSAVKAAAEELGVSGSSASGTYRAGNGAAPAEKSEWRVPQPLPGLPPVAAFDFALLPDTLRPWAEDICERMQCAGDYVGTAIMAAVGSVIGRKIGIRPQAQTDWTEYGNQWALLIGRPGVLKSPAMEQALGPIRRLAAQAIEAHKSEMRRHTERLKAAAENNEEPPEKPILKRYIANDTTAAALGELHRQNPNGVLVHRDEIVSLLRSLDREENSEARGFYLTGWNANSPYTFDRIIRGLNLHIPAVCLSLLGSSQPGRISTYLRAACTGGAGDDGLIQRFGLLVWPDVSGEWRDVDRWPNAEAKRATFELFDYLDKASGFDLGGQQGQYEETPFLRFDDGGLELFQQWRRGLEARLRSEQLHPALESHLAKYRKLVPGLALILHLAERGTGPVSEEATLQALAWAEFLEGHAIRAYASVTMADVSAAKAILARLRKGDLPRTFAGRDIQRKGWAQLSDRRAVGDALSLLVDLDWVSERCLETDGRPATVYEVNPRAIR